MMGTMKRTWLKTAIIYICYVVPWAVAAIVLSVLSRPYVAALLAIPLPFTAAIFFSFLWAYRSKTSLSLLLSILIRLVAVTAMVVLPCLLRFFVPEFHDGVTALLLFLPPAEALSAYILAVAVMVLDRKFKE